MLSQCPHCSQALNLTPAQLEKIDAALAGLAPGKTLKMGCPKCRQPIELNADGSLGGNAVGGVMQEVLYSQHGGGEDQTAASMVAAAQKRPQPVKLPPEAPKPPELTWLTSGVFDKKDVVEDVPHALLLIGDGEVKTQVSMMVAGLGYTPVFVDSAEEAIDKMQFMNFEAIFLHSRFEGPGGVGDSLFHRHMCEMGMSKRRYIYYVLIGPEFRTLYDLEALANSANLVVNDREVEHLAVVIRKGQNDYETLFGPYLETLKQYGMK
ncbi:MAG: hypothetical protein ACOY3Z_11640 [Thermodesulfobacteriota bacterium]